MSEISIQPIQTRYRGRFFRSRLEARYAIFFDKLGIRWQYEPEGFDLHGGSRYLPDFWIEQGGFFAEVKPSHLSFDGKHRDFCNQTGYGLLLLDGEPAMRIYKVLENMSGDGAEEWPVSLDMDFHDTRDENRFWQFPEDLATSRSIESQFSPRFRKALDAALSERFESAPMGDR